MTSLLSTQGAVRPHVTRVALAAALALGAATSFAQSAPAPAAPSAVTQQQLLERVDALARELEQVKAQLQAMKAAQAAPAAAPVGNGNGAVATAGAPATTTATSAPGAPAGAPPAVAVAPAPAGEPATVISSYGELNYLNSKGATATGDVARFVIGLQHRFDDKTKMASELEVEHTVVSSSDQGEIEVEQLYVEHRLNDTYGLRGGLLLMPIGLLNNNHEPTAYYGVERNFVETAIIPSTWREGGVQLFGEHGNGVSWSAGLSTGFDLSKWDATSEEGRQSPLGSIHQELQLAKAHDIAVFGNVDWRGIPGLRLGMSAFSGGASQAQSGFPSTSARVTLYDVHAQWTPGPWDLSALWTQGHISGAGAFNTTIAGSPTPVPKRIDGWYAQAAYRWQLAGDYTLAPFARYERFNTGRGFDGLPMGIDPGAYGTEAVRTVGVNFQLNPEVVLKADLQRFHLDSSQDRWDLGLGYSF